MRKERFKRQLMDKDKNLLMVVVSGHDRPGITATFSRILYEHRIEVVDIEQASLQNLLGLGQRDVG